MALSFARFTSKLLAQSRGASFLASRALTLQNLSYSQARYFSKSNIVTVNANNALKQIDIARTDLLDQVNTRITEVQGFLDDEVADSKDLGFSLDVKDGTATLIRTIEGKEITVTFRPVEAYIPEEGGEQQEEGEEDKRGPEGEEEGEEEAGESMGGDTFLTLNIAVSKGNQQLTTVCHIDVYGQLHVSSYYFGKSGSQSAEHIDITENISVGIQEYLTKLGINEDLVSFLWAFCRRHQDEFEINRLNDLKTFLE